MRLITGGEVPPERAQRVMAIAHALDIPKSDAMLPILVALDSYQETLTATATAAIGAIQRAAEKTPAGATRQLTAIAIVALAVIVGAAVGAWARRDVPGTDPALTRWATSPAGRAAYAFDHANPERGVWLLTACNFPGWRRATHLGRPACVVATEHGKPDGWYLPESKR